MGKCAERASVVCERWMDIALTSQQKPPLWCGRTELWITTAVGTLRSEVATGKWKHMVGSMDYRRALQPQKNWHHSAEKRASCLGKCFWYASLKPVGITNAASPAALRLSSAQLMFLHNCTLCANK